VAAVRGCPLGPMLLGSLPVAEQLGRLDLERPGELAQRGGPAEAARIPCSRALHRQLPRPAVQTHLTRLLTELPRRTCMLCSEPVAIFDSACINCGLQES